MKQYSEYMNSVVVSPEFHERLTGLTAPKRTAAWKKYGAMAAALALVIGAGAFGLSHLPGADAILYGTAEIREVEPEPSIEIVPVDPDDGWDLAGDQPDIDGGYEVVDGEMAEYLLLPGIIYNEQSSEVGTDYALAPPGALSRGAVLDDVKALLGGADMAVHLLWSDELEWGGTLWFQEDGTPCAAALSAEGDGVSFYIEMMVGSEVPSCTVSPDDDCETTTFNGVEITALKNTGYMVWDDGTELRESRKLSCFADGVGYKLTIYGTDGERVEAMCARFARWAIVEGFDLSALALDGAAPMDTDPDYSVGEPNWEDEANTQAYDPAAGN